MPSSDCCHMSSGSCPTTRPSASALAAPTSTICSSGRAICCATAGLPAQYFRRRFRAVLIDEFQDTDPVQAELALLLTSDEEPAGDWRALRPGPGRLTVVGDPKQSIYRFRRADIAVYDQVKTRSLHAGGEQISTNFRSNPALLAGLNAAFDQILQTEPGVQPGNVTLEAPTGASPARRPPIIVPRAASWRTLRASAGRRRA